VTVEGVTKTLKIADSTHEKLTKLGTRVGDTYDDVINRLVDEHNQIKDQIAMLTRDDLNQLGVVLQKDTKADIVKKIIDQWKDNVSTSSSKKRERVKPHTA
jgi:predicted RNA-binding protein with PIN domain